MEQRGDERFKQRSKWSDEGVGTRRKRFNYREGVAVFVDYVVKKIHPSTLKEVFNVFSTLEEARKAVEKGHNRRMDSFFIRVFMGRDQQGKPTVC
ncbi:hypothetical protein V6N13_025695 [Hibiscus sabdariffa]